MIIYDPMWKTLNDKDISTYDLIYKYGLSANTIHRIKNEMFCLGSDRIPGIRRRLTQRSLHDEARAV